MKLKELILLLGISGLGILAVKKLQEVKELKQEENKVNVEKSFIEIEREIQSAKTEEELKKAKEELIQKAIETVKERPELAKPLEEKVKYYIDWYNASKPIISYNIKDNTVYLDVYGYAGDVKGNYAELIVKYAGETIATKRVYVKTKPGEMKIIEIKITKKLPEGISPRVEAILKIRDKIYKSDKIIYR